jgi:hypothetical protein
MTNNPLNQQNSILLTIFLRHDQSKTLAEIGEYLGKAGFWKKSPPKGWRWCTGT